MSSVIVKILRTEEFDTFRRTGRFEGSADDLRDGFIHLSTPTQVAGTLAKHYVMQDGGGEPGLTLAVFESARFGNHLRWEPSRANELFPHVYGTLEWDSMTQSTPLTVGDDGRHILPDDLF